MYFRKFNREDYDNTYNDIVSKIIDNDDNFNNELNIFVQLENNYNDKTILQKSLNIINQLMNDYKDKYKEHKFELFKIKYKPFLLKIPNSEKYEKINPKMYFVLSDFEENCYEFFNYVIKLNNLIKSFYILSCKNFKKSKKNKYKGIKNVYFTLKSIEILQKDLDKYFNIYNIYIQCFKNQFDVTLYNKVDINKIDFFEYYFDTLNGIKKESIIHPHY